MTFLRSRHRASTLVELILYMAMTIIIVMGLTTVAARIRTAQSTSSGQTELQQSIRTALLQLSAIATTYETGAVLPDSRFPNVADGVVLWNSTEQTRPSPETYLHLFIQNGVFMLQKTTDGTEGEKIILTNETTNITDATFQPGMADNVPEMSYSFIASVRNAVSIRDQASWSVASSIMLRPTNVPLKDVCCPFAFKSACSSLIPLCPSSCAEGSVDPACLPPPLISFHALPVESSSSSVVSEPIAPICAPAETGMTKLLLYDRIDDPIDASNDNNFIQDCGEKSATFMYMDGPVPSSMERINSITYRIRVRANADREDRVSTLRTDLFQRTSMLAAGPVITINGASSWRTLERTFSSGSLIVSQQEIIAALQQRKINLLFRSLDENGFIQISAVELSLRGTDANGQTFTMILTPSFSSTFLQEDHTSPWQPVGIANSLLGFWGFEEPGGVIATDGNGETDGRLVEGTTVTDEQPWPDARTTTDLPAAGQGGQSALSFPSFSPTNPLYHSVRIGAGPELDFDGTKAFSFAFWLKPAPLNTTHPINMIVFDKTQDDNAGYNLALYSGASAYYLQFLWGTSSNSIMSPAAGINPGAWSFVIVSYDPTKPPLERAAISVNGIASSVTQGTKRLPSVPNPSTMRAESVPFRLGASANPNYASFTPFQGGMDDIRVYDHIVTLPEISASLPEQAP